METIQNQIYKTVAKNLWHQGMPLSKDELTMLAALIDGATNDILISIAPLPLKAYFLGYKIQELLKKAGSFSEMKKLLDQFKRPPVMDTWTRDTVATAIAKLVNIPKTTMSDTLTLRFLEDYMFTEITWYLDNMQHKIRQEMNHSLLNNESPLELARRLHKTFDAYDIDMRRVAITETTRARNKGTLNSIIQTNPAREHALVYFIVAGDACKHCKRLYLYPDGSPKLFEIKDIINETNKGRKVPQWRAAILIHPNCRCYPVEYFPELKEWQEKWQAKIHGNKVVIRGGELVKSEAVEAPPGGVYQEVTVMGMDKHPERQPMLKKSKKIKKDIQKGQHDTSLEHTSTGPDLIDVKHKKAKFKKFGKGELPPGAEDDNDTEKSIPEPDPVKKNIDVHGINIGVEFPKGSVRTYDNSDYKTPMHADYGRISGTESDNDEMCLDCYVGPDRDNETVYRVRQLKKNGDFDEFKYMIGYPDKKAAVLSYKMHMPEWMYGGVKTLDLPSFEHTIVLNLKPEEVSKAIGTERPGHKYIRREGQSGGYKYIYEDETGKEYEGQEPTTAEKPKRYYFDEDLGIPYEKIAQIGFGSEWKVRWPEGNTSIIDTFKTKLKKIKPEEYEKKAKEYHEDEKMRAERFKLAKEQEAEEEAEKRELDKAIGDERPGHKYIRREGMPGLQKESKGIQK